MKLIYTTCLLWLFLTKPVVLEVQKEVFPDEIDTNDLLDEDDIGPFEVTPVYAIGNHDFCGPYTNVYAREQCGFVGTKLNSSKFGTEVSECEKACRSTLGCSALDWSPHGCNLWACGLNPPMPALYEKNVLSFSMFKPKETPHCKNLHGSYNTPKKYCGPYPKHYTESQCREVGKKRVNNVLLCEFLCELDTNCNVFNWQLNKNAPGRMQDDLHECVLRACWGRLIPNPIAEDPDWVSYTKQLPFRKRKCILDVRLQVDP